MNTINRIKKDKNFAILDKGFLQNPVLSAKSKGVLAYILSLPDDWVLYKSELHRHFKDGRDGINSALNELKQHGYLTEDVGVRNEKGLMTHNNITVYEVPIHVGLSVTVEPQRSDRNGEPVTTNIDLPSTDKVIKDNVHSANVLDSFENVWKHYPLKKKKKTAIEAYKRAKKKGVEDSHIINAIEAYKKEMQLPENSWRSHQEGGTWFNQERWDDDYSNVQKASSQVAASSLPAYEPDHIEEATFKWSKN